MFSHAASRVHGLSVLFLLGPLAGGACSDDPCAGATGTGGLTDQPGALVSYLGDPAFPDDFWTSATPEESGVDAALLARAVGRIACTKSEIHSFLLARHGRLLFEQYGWKSGRNVDDPDKTSHQALPNERHLVHSTTKSITSTLVGIAIRDGLVPGVDDLVVPHFPEYQPLPEPSPEKDGITLEDLLTMRSGLKEDDAEADQSPDPAEVMLSQPIVGTPGQAWSYSDGVADITAALLRKVTGKTPLAYANEELFVPLGLSDVPWQAPANGTNFGGWGIALTPREMARFGELYRNQGLWDGEQIVPADWTDTATTPRCETPWNAQYGYYFWIPKLSGFFATSGLYGQNIYVNRELGLVAVFTADLSVTGANSFLESLMRDFVIPAMK
jgi:CubicO group peptidase (beta-lactamase class C family)